MNRILFVDVAKAICIILVVIGHCFPDNSPKWYVTLHDIIYTFHMPLFMFASGYVYIATQKPIAYTVFLLRKIKRLLVPYFITSFIVITIKILTQESLNVDNPVTIFSYLWMFCRPEAGYYLWFIWALWWMFVLVPLCDTKQKRLILFLVSSILCYIPLNFPHEFCLYEFKRMFVFFMLGIISYEYKWLHNIISNYNLLRTAYVTILFVVLQSINTLSGGGIFALMLPYMGILTVIEISKFLCYRYEINISSKLMFISVSSYIIYLFHTTFEGFTRAIFLKLPLNKDLWYIFILEVAIVVTCGIVGPMLIYALFKKYKFTRMLFGLMKN